MKMGFPNLIYGDYGDEKRTSSTKIGSLPLGTRMVLPDGRLFVHAKCSATAGIAGNVYMCTQGVCSGDGAYIKDMAPAATVSAAATTITLTAGATTAVTEDLFEDGYVFVNDVTGEGECYKIKSNNSTAAGSTFTVTLYETDDVKTALPAGTSQVGIHECEWHSLTVISADTVMTGPLAGILPVAVTASYYCWVQRRGVCAALTDGTVIVGEPVTPSGALAGAVAVHAVASTSTVKLATKIGNCLNVAASTEYSLIDLTIE